MPPVTQLKVVFQDPTTVTVPTLFANHLAVSRAGTEIQFEFVAVDINVLATKMEAHQSQGLEEPIEITGKTVAKIVVPLHVFVQLEGHLGQIFSAIRHEFALKEGSPNERRAIS
jgi:hypothetical protein